MFLCNNRKGIISLTRLRFGLSNLQEHRFKHNFKQTFLIQFVTALILIQFVTALKTLNSRVSTFFTVGIGNILELGDSKIVEVILHGRKSLDISTNTNILNATIFFFLETKGFDDSKNQWNHGLLHFYFSSVISFFRLFCLFVCLLCSLLCFAFFICFILLSGIVNICLVTVLFYGIFHFLPSTKK